MGSRVVLPYPIPYEVTIKRQSQCTSSPHPLGAHIGLYKGAEKGGAIFDVNPYNISTYGDYKSNCFYSEIIVDLGLFD